MKHIIFDLDGTLADCTHRVPMLPNWDAFYEACDKDEPIAPIVSIYNHLVSYGHYHIHVWSGRRESEIEKTAAWFNRHALYVPYTLKFRPNGDHRPDTELKGEWLDEAKFTPYLVFEDRASVVQMYRDRGIRVCQVAPGDF